MPAPSALENLRAADSAAALCTAEHARLRARESAAFGAWVRETRRELKIPMREFAKRLGVSAGMATFLENAGREWTLKRAEVAVKLLR